MNAYQIGLLVALFAALHGAAWITHRKHLTVPSDILVFVIGVIYVWLVVTGLVQLFIWLGTL